MSIMFNALLVEDDCQVSTTLKNALSRLGYVVHCASSSTEAKEELHKNDYAVVFAELCTKDGSGRSIARWMKKKGLESKFFIVTGWKGAIEKNLLSHDGIDGVIRKPLIFNEIKSALE